MLDPSLLRRLDTRRLARDKARTTERRSDRPSSKPGEPHRPGGRRSALGQEPVRAGARPAAWARGAPSSPPGRRSTTRWPSGSPMHVRTRGADFRTVEEPMALPGDARSACGDVDVVVVDCLTLWLSNLLLGAAEATAAAARRGARRRAGRRARAAAVSHRSSSPTKSAWASCPRRRSAACSATWPARAHQRLAALADEIHLAVMGTILRLRPEPLAVEPHDEEREPSMNDNDTTWRRDLRPHRRARPAYRRETQRRLDDKTKPRRSLGRLEEIWPARSRRSAGPPSPGRRARRWW